MKRLALCALVLLGCGGDTTATPVVNVGSSSAIITSRDSADTTGSINSIALGTHAAKKGIDTTIDPDTVVHVINGKLYLLNAFTNTLRIYDPSTFAAPTEISIGGTMAMPNLYPWDFTVIGTNAYVSFEGNLAAQAIGVVDLTSASGVTSFIAVSTATADTDGNAEAGAIYSCGGNIYVALADINETTYQPTGPGRVAVIDVATAKTTATIQLGKQNPSGFAQETSDCHDVLIGEGPQGVTPSDTTAGIERVNLTTMAVTSAFTSTQLGGTPETIDVYTPTLGYATILYNPQVTPMNITVLSSSKVVAFNPSTGTIIGDATGVSGNIVFARVSGDGQLFVGVQLYPTLLVPGSLLDGVYIGKADGSNITAAASPITLGQSPVAIDFN